MSQLDSNLASGGVLVQKPRSNVYTVMLALSLVALLVGIFFLWLELKAYNFEINGPVGSAVYETSESLAVSQTNPLPGVERHFAKAMMQS